MHHYRSCKILKPAIAAIIFCYLSACAAPEDSLEKVAKSKQGEYRINTIHLDASESPKYTNRLIRQTSPYLLQHAHNPVDWWSWSDEAFAAAKAQDKPILLSIGYSTCHWCHVMERESFENIEIAEFINANFIPIKVDREEHPDIDETYLTAVQLLSGKVGWPLTAVLSPNADAFFGGTYFSPERFLPLLKKIDDTWRTNRGAIDEQAGRLKQSMAKLNEISSAANAIDHAAIALASEQIANDLAAAPRRSQPGFPREPEMLFLLHRAILEDNRSLLSLLTQRLTMLSASGIHDHIGGGFHRYSVDTEFTIPHFEKMLYNQAQMAQLLTIAGNYSNDSELQKTGRRVLDFLLEDFSNVEQTGFYSAMDAESDGIEGGFYIWSYSELQQHLTKAEMTLLEQRFEVTPAGNFNGYNVLSLKNNSDLRTHANTSKLLLKLGSLRQKHTPPNIDHKLITAWNAMSISALLAGYRTLGNSLDNNLDTKQYLERALKVAENLWSSAYSATDGLRRTQANSTPITATLDDYAYTANAFLDAYDVTANPTWLARAETLTQRMTQDFLDAETGAFFMSNQADTKGLSISLLTARDDSIYSGNSMAAQVLARLFNRTGNIQHRDSARAVIAHFANSMTKSPVSSSGLWLAASMLLENETSSTLYAARGKIRVQSAIEQQQLLIKIDTKPGWHINANQVLSEFLIPTTLSESLNSCAELESIHYPTSEKVSLAFQQEALLVYQGETRITANVGVNVDKSSCASAAMELRVQACSDEVCLSPVTLPLRVPL